MDIFDFELRRVRFYGKSAEDRRCAVDIPPIYLQKMKIDEEDCYVKVTFNHKTKQIIIEKRKSWKEGISYILSFLESYYCAKCKKSAKKFLRFA